MPKVSPEEARKIVRERKLTEAGVSLDVLKVEGIAPRTRAAVESLRAAGRDDEQIDKLMCDDTFVESYLFFDKPSFSDDEVDEQLDALNEMGIEA